MNAASRCGRRALDEHRPLEREKEGGGGKNGTPTTGRDTPTANGPWKKALSDVGTVKTPSAPRSESTVFPQTAGQKRNGEESC